MTTVRLSFCGARAGDPAAGIVGLPLFVA